MQDPALFFPGAIYSKSATDTPPMVMAAPPRYIQGPGCLSFVGRYLQTMGVSRVAILASVRGHSTQAGQVAESLSATGVESIDAIFNGECCLEEIGRHVDALRSAEIDLLIAVGGGKCVDAGKCISYRLSVPLVVVPTLASNDAPCSAVSVLYRPDGVVSGAEFFPQNPALVVVDTQVIADAAPRYLVAGMGDAMATWYEAKVCAKNPRARNVLGARPTLTACAMGELCARTLFADGEGALQSVTQNTVGDKLERVVEANTLLSGVGFESGGLAAAHGYAQGFTAVPVVENNYLHGEMVAMGVITQLVLENDLLEAKRVAIFFAKVGLPVHLGQLGMSPNRQLAASVADGAMAFDGLRNLPFEVTAETVKRALFRADALGMDVSGELGDQAYRKLHNSNG